VFSDRILEDFCKDGFVIIFGSSWEAEEKIALDFYKKNKTRISNLKIIIAPHEFDETKKPALENLFQEEIMSYSSYTIQNTPCAVLLLDKKGILKYVYRYANIAVIGGGFGKSVHNISEAAVYSLPTIFGPNFSKFEDAKELVNLKVAFPVNDYMEFENKLIQLINDAELRIAISKKLNSYFLQQENATAKIISEVLK
jgi:3-deoxy-D-manno-octulosonic-acid transferase